MIATILLGHFHQLPAMIEGEYKQLFPLFARHADLMQTLQGYILIRTGDRHRAIEQVVEFGRRRHRRGAGMPRHHQPAAGIGQLAATLIAGIFEPAAEEAGHKGIAGAQHVKHLNPHAGINRTVFKPGRNVAMDHRASLGAQFDHQRCRSHCPHRAQCSQQVGAATGNQEFFFSAHDQVEARQDRLHVRGHFPVFDKAGFAIGLACQPPKHRTVIDVQNPFDVVLLGVLKGLDAGLVDPLGGEVSAGDQQCLARRYKRRIDVFCTQCHIGAVFAVEHQREGFAVFKTQQHQCGEALGIEGDGTHVAAFASQ